MMRPTSKQTVQTPDIWEQQGKQEDGSVLPLNFKLQQIKFPYFEQIQSQGGSLVNNTDNKWCR